ncbi:MAG: enoyl-CoA hydratase-related protein [Actinomycetota bacterium]|nr:enoyl-CoA hydratase-related protein [Actinomycetota bacterium]
MNDPVVTLTVTDRVATVTLDSPTNRNALSPALIDGLGDALGDAIIDRRSRVILLTHTGPAFCAGADLRAVGGTRAARHTVPDILATIADSPKPVVARVAGHVMAGGVGLVAACDLSVATDDVRFGFTEVRVGVAPAIISVVCLPKLSRADAAELLLTGERIPAARAVEVGLINRCVSSSELDATVDAWVTALIAGGPRALAAAKRLIAEVPALDRDTAFIRTAEWSAELFASEEAAEGMAAWAEKRPAAWIPAGPGPAPRGEPGTPG